MIYTHGPIGGVIGGVAGDGVCGAPIAEEDVDFAGIAGSNSEHCLSAVLGKLIDYPWSLE